MKMTQKNHVPGFEADPLPIPEIHSPILERPSTFSQIEKVKGPGKRGFKVKRFESQESGKTYDWAQKETEGKKLTRVKKKEKE